VGTAALALLHALVFVYWVGGDLGAFYASFLLGDPRLSLERRIAAAQVVAAVDMAPRSALVLALPTGLTLARAQGWLEVQPLALGAVWLGAIVWLCLVWALHLTGAERGSALRRVDLVIRWSVLIGTLTAGFAIVSGQWQAPRFIGWKLLLLAAAIGAGLGIRAFDVGSKLGAFVREGTSPALDHSLAQALTRVRPLVILIWVLVLSAAFLGIWRPL